MFGVSFKHIKEVKQMVESLRLRGRYVDMQLHDDLDDSWMLMRAGTKEVLVIGSRTQIMNEYRVR